MIDLNAYWQFSKYRSPTEFRSEPSGVTRPDANISGASIPPDSAQSGKYYRPAEFRYERPNANRPNAYVSDVPVQPGDARSVYVGDLAGEMIQRSSDAKALAQRKKDAEKNHTSVLDAIAREQATYASLKSKFIESYVDFDTTADQLGDRLELSDRAKTYLADLATLEKLRGRISRLEQFADDEKRQMPRDLATMEALNELSAAGWSMRFAGSKNDRIEAFDRFNEAGNRLEIYGAERSLEHQRRDVRDAAVKAGNAALTAGLQGPALFKVTDNGRIDFDATGLGHLSPDARQAEQLKRLVEIMSVRNGFSPLKGAVAEALAIQNAYIAGHPVVAGTVVLPY